MTTAAIKKKKSLYKGVIEDQLTLTESAELLEQERQFKIFEKDPLREAKLEANLWLSKAYARLHQRLWKLESEDASWFLSEAEKGRPSKTYNKKDESALKRMNELISALKELSGEEIAQFYLIFPKDAHRRTLTPFPLEGVIDNAAKTKGTVAALPLVVVFYGMRAECGSFRRGFMADPLVEGVVVLGEPPEDALENAGVLYGCLRDEFSELSAAFKAALNL